MSSKNVSFISVIRMNEKRQSGYFLVEQKRPQKARSKSSLVVDVHQLLVFYYYYKWNDSYSKLNDELETKQSLQFSGNAGLRVYQIYNLHMLVKLIWNERLLHTRYFKTKIKTYCSFFKFEFYATKMEDGRLN